VYPFLSCMMDNETHAPELPSDGMMLLLVLVSNKVDAGLLSYTLHLHVL
jgi:hypothetical protein